jgi:hypothetical protein
MKKLLVFLIIVSALGCGVPKNLRTPDDPNCSIIGISVRTATLTIFVNKPDIVYFVKLDEKDENNLGNRIYASNYTRGDYAYLINAKPGTYAAVASYFSQTENGYNTFYDATIIRSTLIQVGPGQVLYAGELRIENQMKNLYQNIEQNGDKSQIHYYTLLKSIMYGTFYCGKLEKSERSKESEIEFLKKTRVNFKDSDWIPVIDKMLEMIDK